MGITLFWSVISADGRGDVGKMRTSAAFHPSRKVKLALVPLVGLAVAAFATPARAGTVANDLPPLPTEVTSVAADIAAVRDPVVASTAIEPAGDGSEIAVATVIEPSAPPSTASEIPANALVEVEAEPSPVPADPLPSTVIPPTAVAPQPAPPTPAAEPSTRQYHAAPAQYQPTRAVQAQSPRSRRATHVRRAHLKPRAAALRAPQRVSRLVQIMSRICADIDLGNLAIPVANEVSNSGSNVGQIGDCIVDQIGLELPLEGVAAPSSCSSDAQYQPVSGQYQTGVDVCAPSSPAPAVTAPPGPVGGSHVDASIPAFRASPITPPVLEAPPIPAPAIASARSKAQRAVRAAPATRTDHVLAVTAEHAFAPLEEVSHPSARVGPPLEPRSAHPIVPRITGPRTRIEALRAQPDRVASNPDSPSVTSPWLMAAAMLLLFGVVSLASALVGTVGTSRTALRQLGVRASSRGLSRHPLGRNGRRQRGIRYRD
jgi:hypothetical protein